MFEDYTYKQNHIMKYMVVFNFAYLVKCRKNLKFNTAQNLMTLQYVILPSAANFLSILSLFHLIQPGAKYLLFPSASQLKHCLVFSGVSCSTLADAISENRQFIIQWRIKLQTQILHDLPVDTCKSLVLQSQLCVMHFDRMFHVVCQFYV